MPDPLPPADCAELPTAQRIPGLTLAIEGLRQPLRPRSVTSPTTALLRLRNSSARRIRFETGFAFGTLVERGGSLKVSGVYGLVVPAIATGIDVAPGGVATMTVLVGLTSGDPARGHAVPPGDYDLVVVLPVLPNDPPLVSARLPVTVAG